MGEILDNHYFVDFETTSIENYYIDGEVRVFMWRVENCFGDGKEGADIITFLNHMKRLSKNRTIYVWFHNLKFDFSFIEWALLKYGVAKYKHNIPSRFRFTTWGKEYTTTRDDMNNLYGVDWFTAKKSTVKFRDSAKIFPMTLKRLGDMVGVKKLDETYDYEMYRGLSYTPTEEEWEYLRHDTAIVRKAMIQHFKRYKQVRMTRSSYAFADLRDDFNKNNTPKDWQEIKKKHKYKKNVTYFDHCFPKTDTDLYKELAPAYAGGIVYVNPLYRNKIIEDVLAYDVNSEYPAAMLDNDYPIGKEVKFNGLYANLPKEIKDKYPLYVQYFKCDFELKKGGFPMLPKKFSNGRKTIYSSDQLKGSGVLALCNVDLEHFLRNYDVKNFTFLGGYMWQSIHAPFKSYIERVAKEKIDAEEKGDMIGREMAKLNMNSCYGKFAQRPDRGSKAPYLDDNDVLRYKEVDEEEEGRNYFPMAIFITAYARDILLNGIYEVGVDRLLYTDTDSIHIKGHERPKNLPVHKTKLGYWDLEGVYNKGKFLRDKFYGESYINDEGEEVLILKGAGISDEAKGKIKSFDEFMLGVYYEGNLQARQVKGGTLLINKDKYVKPDRDIATPDEIKRDDEHLATLKKRRKEAKEKLEKEIAELRESLRLQGRLDVDVEELV